jgi:putative CocE/NonD family hydrolase
MHTRTRFSNVTPVPRRALACLSPVLLTLGLLVGVSVGSHGAAGTTDPIQDAIAASAAPGHHWAPEDATYAVSRTNDVPVQMADGTVLRADVATPADPTTHQPAAGPFPVLLTMSPYGKDTAGQLNSSAIGLDTYFVKRGYIDVVVDVRGAGNSGGHFTLFDPKQTADGVALVHWAAGLPHSTGEVGMHGASYLGIDQMLTAGAVGPNSPLKAIFPIVSANEVYRDTAFMGGIPDAEFDAAYLGALLPVIDILDPVAAALLDPKNLLGSAQALLTHLSDVLNYNAEFLLQTFFGGPDSYDTAYWQVRSPGSVLDQIVANGIPAYLVGGEYDLFQRGEPLNFAGLQNAWSGRPSSAPMLAGQSVTGRYQLLDGPFTHLSAAIGTTMDELQLEWFDTWLKGADTGMGQTPTPLHYYDLGTGHYANTTTYPLTGTSPTTLYFSGARSGSAPSRNDGTLTASAPTSASGADTVNWLPVGSSICDRSIDQWSMGVLSLVTGGGLASTPCLQDDRLGQTGPTALTYTTAPFAQARTLAGPISATIYASAKTPETEWVVNVEDVAPDGVSKPLTQGALLGSLRAVDASRSWQVGGSSLLPYHPYTKASAVPVTKGAVTRYDVEVFPTYSTIAAGHRLRVTIDTTDFPHLVPTPPQLAKLFGGVYQVQRTAAAPSAITVPFVS